MSWTAEQIGEALPFVNMKRGISAWCDRAVHYRAPFSDHGWCMNRNARECQCDCPCHWSVEEREKRMAVSP